MRLKPPIGVENLPLVDQYNALLGVQQKWLTKSPPEAWGGKQVLELTEWCVGNALPNTVSRAVTQKFKEELAIVWTEATVEQGKRSNAADRDWRSDENVWKPLLALFSDPKTGMPPMDPAQRLSWIEHVVVKHGENHLEFACHALKACGASVLKSCMKEYGGKNPQYVHELALERGKLAFFLYPNAHQQSLAPSPRSRAEEKMCEAWLDGIFEEVKSTPYADATFAFLEQMATLPYFRKSWCNKRPNIFEVGREKSPVAWVKLWSKLSAEALENQSNETWALKVPDELVLETTSTMVEQLSAKNKKNDPYEWEKGRAKQVWGSLSEAVAHATRWRLPIERKLLIQRVDLPDTEAVTKKPAL